MGNSRVTNGQILAEIRILANSVTTLARQVDRLEERLSNVETGLIRVQARLDKVEEQTRLIPGVAESIMAFADNFDSNEKRFKKLESLLA